MIICTTLWNTEILSKQKALFAANKVEKQEKHLLFASGLAKLGAHDAINAGIDAAIDS